MKTKKDKRKASKARKLATLEHPVITTPKTSNKTEAETQLERIKKAAKTRASKTNPAGKTKGKFSIPIAGTTTNYDAFILERKAIPEKDIKIKFVRPSKRYKLYSRK